MTEDPLPLCLARPVGNHLRTVGLDILLRNGIALQFAGVEHLQILHAVAGELRKGGHALGPRTPFAHDQLPLAQVDLLPPAVVVKISRPQHRNGQLPEVLFVKCRFVQRPFDGERRFRLDAQLPQLLDPSVHAGADARCLGFIVIPLAGSWALGSCMMLDDFFEHFVVIDDLRYAENEVRREDEETSGRLGRAEDLKRRNGETEMERLDAKLLILEPPVLELSRP